MQTNMRIFCALELPGEVRARVGAYLDNLRQSLAGARVRWEAVEKLHLTIKFLGEVKVTRLDDLTQAVSNTASRINNFELRIEGTGIFPPRGAARVLWLGVKDPSGELSRMRKLLEDECAAAGFAREERAFHPHLTLARLNQLPAAKARHAAELHLASSFEASALTIEHLALVKSELRPSGSLHTVLSRHQLRDQIYCEGGN